MATNKSLKRDLRNNKSETIITSFNVSENVKGEDNVQMEEIKDVSSIQMDVMKDVASAQGDVIKDNASVQSEGQEDFKQVEIQMESIVPVKALNKDIINEEDDDSMNIKIFKSYMELCKSVGLIPSWPELNKFKDYYVG